MIYILVYDCSVYISTFFRTSRPPHPSRLGGQKTNFKDENRHRYLYLYPYLYLDYSPSTSIL